MSRTCPAMSNAICSPSMAQGPAIRKKLPESVFFSRGMSICIMEKLKQNGVGGCKSCVFREIFQTSLKQPFKIIC